MLELEKQVVQQIEPQITMLTKLNMEMLYGKLLVQQLVKKHGTKTLHTSHSLNIHSL